MKPPEDFTEKQNVALVVGSTGIVGESLVCLLSKPDTAGGPWKVYGLARRARPDWLEKDDLYVQCDLLNRDDVFAKMAPLTDVTHLFWVTWMQRPTEEENCSVNAQTFQNAFDALVPNAKNLQHVALQTGGKHYMGPFERAGEALPREDTPYLEDLPRLPVRNFYYAQEDVMFEAVKKMNGKLTWSVHRPGVIVGATAGNLINLVQSVAVYASICKHENMPFLFPGTQFCWDNLLEASNCDLVAEQEVWAATDPRGKNQAFNTMNGDQFRWRRAWKNLAGKLGVEFVSFDGKPRPLAETMKGMEPVWDKIVKENRLYPSKLKDVGHWWVVDWTLQTQMQMFWSMNKSREHGFLGFRNTEKTMVDFIDVMRKRKLIP